MISPGDVIVSKGTTVTTPKERRIDVPRGDVAFVLWTFEAKRDDTKAKKARRTMRVMVLYRSGIGHADIHGLEPAREKG